MGKTKTIKTSLSSILKDNSKSEEFKIQLNETLTTIHLLRVGIQQFLQYYVLNFPNDEPITLDFVRAGITVLNGLYPKSLDTSKDFGRLFGYLDHFIQENPEQSNWRCKEFYKDIVEAVIKELTVPVNKLVNALKERIQIYLDQYPKSKLWHYVQLIKS